MTMTVFLEVQNGYVLLQLPSPIGEASKLDYETRVLPGGDWHGLTYTQLRDLGTGQHEVELK